MKTALITGTSSGIGLELIKKFDKEGIKTISLFQLNKRITELLDLFLRQIKSLLIVFFMMHPHGQLQIYMILTMLLRQKILKEP